MKQLYPIVAICLLCASVQAQAQQSLPSAPGSSMRTPSDPGIKTPPDPGTKSPANSGKVVVPPNVDPGAVEKPPAQVDPKIDDATGAIDRQNRTESQDKPQKKAR